MDSYFDDALVVMMLLILSFLLKISTRVTIIEQQVNKLDEFTISETYSIVTSQEEDTR